MSDSIPAEFLPTLATASAELLHAGLLVQFSDSFALERADSGRKRFESENALDAETNRALQRARSVAQTTRGIVTAFPEAVNASIRENLEQTENRDELERRFRSASESGAEDFSAIITTLCRRIEESFEQADAPMDSNGTVPPVTGGSDSLGCDLILIGAMAGGATCVIGCAPCCVAGAAGGLIFLGLC